MSSQTYQHAIDSGVYLAGVDTSFIGARAPVDRAAVGVDPLVFLVIGQSNGGNHGDTKFAAARPVFNFNPFDGLIYPAADPLMGATGDGGSPWCLLGDRLIAAGLARSVMFTSLCVGGATVADWAPGGSHHYRLVYALGRLREAGYRPTHVLWHQGEADSLYGTSAADYVNSFRALVAALRALDVEAPIYVAVATFFAVPEGYEKQQAVIRGAQQSLVDPARGIFAGPDTDGIRARFDGCHMAASGLQEHARSWSNVLLGQR